MFCGVKWNLLLLCTKDGAHIVLTLMNDHQNYIGSPLGWPNIFSFVRGGAWGMLAHEGVVEIY